MKAESLNMYIDQEEQDSHKELEYMTNNLTICEMGFKETSHFGNGKPRTGAGRKPTPPTGSQMRPT
jgi:hypothetical protein